MPRTGHKQGGPAAGGKFSKLEWMKRLRGVELSGTDYAVLWHLFTYTGGDGRNAHPGVAVLARDAQVSESSVKRSLRKFRTLGIAREAKPGGRRGDGTTYAAVYDLMPDFRGVSVAQRVKSSSQEVKYASQELTGGPPSGPLASDHLPSGPDDDPSSIASRGSRGEAPSESYGSALAAWVPSLDHRTTARQRGVDVGKLEKKFRKWASGTAVENLDAAFATFINREKPTVEPVADIGAAVSAAIAAGDVEKLRELTGLRLDEPADVWTMNGTGRRYLDARSQWLAPMREELMHSAANRI